MVFTEVEEVFAKRVVARLISFSSIFCGRGASFAVVGSLGVLWLPRDEGGSRAPRSATKYR